MGGDGDGDRVVYAFCVINYTLCSSYAGKLLMEYRENVASLLLWTHTHTFTQWFWLSSSDVIQNWL